MTEDEAETKWCPFAAIIFEQFNIAANRLNSTISMIPDASKCIGSGCMAWRWQYDSEYQVFIDNNGNRFEANTVGRLDEAKENNYKPFIPEHGHCGLAE